jgi:2-polyprenyl-3-methyl-5-hydroxy-6-metoxy-1,4-benzoquinol methylase
MTNHRHFSESYRTLVFTATYNEFDNIQSLLDDVWNEIPYADILVVDDNSPDGTGALLDQIAVANRQLKVVHRYKKLGLGTAHHLAMVYAIKQNYDVLVTMDADHSHDPAEIPRLLEKLSQADFVIGSRYMPGGRCDYGGYRKFLSVSANTAARFLLGIPLHEFTTSYRALRVSALAKLNFAKMHNRGYSYFMESVYRFNQAGLKLAEVPIYFHNRNAGSSKIPRLEIVRGVLKLFHLLLSRIIRRKIQASSPLIEGVCANCHSSFLSTRFPPKLTVFKESNMFRCSSVGNTSKPHIAKCLQCDLNQVQQSEHPKGLEDLYADVVDQDYLNNLPVKRKTFAHAYQRIEPFLTNKGNLIEIGSYCGLFLTEAKRHGWNVTGIEPSRWAARYAMSDSGCKVINGSLEMVAPSLEEKFDVAVSWDVLEHVRDPAEYLRIINGLLKTGGTVALSTLDTDTWFPRLMGRNWPWIMEMHLFYFDSAVLQQMLREAGFEVLRVESYRHYVSLRYIYKKICTYLPGRVKTVFLTGSRLIPEWIIPVTLGDIKLYVGKKIHPPLTQDKPHF